MTRIRGFFSHAGFVWNRNLLRLLLALIVLTALIAADGTVQVIQMGDRADRRRPGVRDPARRSRPSYIIFQFGIMFWFLSRPRKYTVTPDDPQIGMTFENYRGQPDLLEHAKSTVGILRGVKEFELRGGEMPQGHAPVGRARAPARRSSPRSSRRRRSLPFIYIDASSLQGMFIGMTQLMIMKLFRDARGLARKYAEPGQRGACIMFMDEIDSIGMSRGGQGGSGMADGRDDGR